MVKVSDIDPTSALGPLCGLQSNISRGPRSANPGFMQCSTSSLAHLVREREQRRRHATKACSHLQRRRDNPEVVTIMK